MTLPKRITLLNEVPAHRDRNPLVPWLTQSWLAEDNRYKRIATAVPRLGTGLIGRGLLEHHISLMPSVKCPADFISVCNEGWTTTRRHGEDSNMATAETGIHPGTAIISLN